MMKRKALSLFLALVLALTLVPVSAVADEGGEDLAEQTELIAANELVGAVLAQVEGISVVEGTGSSKVDVGGTEFETIADAWAEVASAGSGTTVAVRLLDDVTAAGDLSADGVTVNLNLNGHILQMGSYKFTGTGTINVSDGTGKYVPSIEAGVLKQPKNLAYTASDGTCITTVTVTADQEHTGSAIELDEEELVVKYDGAALVKDTDYTVTYANNTHVTLFRKATVTIAGTGEYAGTVQAEFSIGLSKAEKIITGTVMAVGAAVTIGIAAKTVKDYIDARNAEKTEDSADTNTTTDPAGKADTTTSTKTNATDPAAASTDWIVTKVTVDDTALESQYYTVSGENVTISPDYLKTLSDGKHTVRIYSGDDVLSSVDITIKDQAVVESAKTGDAGALLYAGLALAAILCGGIVLSCKRRRAC